MGTILPWPSQQERARERERFKSEPKGEILFFTGVRYERAPADTAFPGEASSPSVEDARPEPRRA